MTLNFELGNYIMAKKKYSKYHVDISEEGKKKRTYQEIEYDSLVEMQFYQEFVEPKLATGEIFNCERQVDYILQDKFKYNDKTVLPIKYRADYVITWSDHSIQAFDVKSLAPDPLCLIKRKMMWAKYPEVNLTFICRNLKYGGWVEYDKLKKLQREAKKAKRNEDKKEN